MLAPMTLDVSTESDELIYPVEEKLGQGKKHEKRFREIVNFLEIIFEGRDDVFVGGDRFIYLEKGNKRKCVAPDAFVIKGFAGDEPDVFKIWETAIDLRFACEIWSRTNDEAERQRKFGIYQNVLKVPEYVELTRDEQFYTYRLNSEGEYEMILPNQNGRIESAELGAELAFQDGLIRIYQNGSKIPTLQEVLKNR
jgi:Uma2 family endonuclease